MRKVFSFYFLVYLLSIGVVYANGEHSFEDAKKIIDEKIQCSQLTEEQLEHLGDYFMEQMHPGDAHETMDEMMGGEGSESLRQMHIAMAKRMYCNDISGMTQYGMMGMMGSGGMMGIMKMNGGMMNWQTPQTNMMGNWGYFVYWNFLNILYIVLLIGLIVLVYLWIVRLWRDYYGKKK